MSAISLRKIRQVFRHEARKRDYATKEYVLDKSASGEGASTFKKIIYIEDPTATDSYPVFSVPFACTITRISHITDKGTATWNLESRTESAPGTVGSDVFLVDRVSDSISATEMIFENSSLAANSWLHFSASAVASAPAKLWVAITFEVA